jgi:hypothetical protein
MSMNIKKLAKPFRFSALLMLALCLIFSQSAIFANNEVINYGKKVTTYANGSVVDISTGQNCGIATITYISEEGISKSVTTDKNGEFKIGKLETGFYSWYVECDGYYKGSYLSYPVISGGNIYAFEISKDNEVNRTWEQQVATEGAPGDSCSFSEVVENLNKLSNSSISLFSIYNTAAPTPYVPTSVTVKKTSGAVVTVSLEDYIAHVVCREMNPAQNIYNGMSDSQKLVALKAQAIVARGYATYHYYVSRRHSSSTGYYFCDTTHCQVYDPTYSPVLAIQAANETAKQIPAIVSGSPYNWNIDYIDAVFFASCPGSTINVEDSPAFGGTPISYLKGVSCPYDIRPTLTSGHRVGFCQDGAAGYAKNGTTYASDIVTHYYTGVSVVTGQYN